MPDLGQRLFETMQAATNAAGGADARAWDELPETHRDVLTTTAEAFLDEHGPEPIADVPEVTEPNVLAELDDEGDPWVRFLVQGLPDLSWPAAQANVLGYMLTQASLDAEHEANLYSYLIASNSDSEQAVAIIMALRQHRALEQ